MPFGNNQFQRSVLAQRLALAQGRASSQQATSQQHLSLDDEKLMLQRAGVLLHLAETRAALENARTKTLAAAGAIHEISSLNPADPNFKDKYYGLLQTYHEGLGDKGVQSVIASKQSDFNRFQNAQSLFLQRHYSPQELKAYSDAYAATGNADIANAHAIGVREQNEQTNRLVSQLSPQDVVSLTRQSVDANGKPMTDENGQPIKEFDIDGANQLIAQRKGVIASNEQQFNALASQNKHYAEMLTALRGHVSNTPAIAGMSDEDMAKIGLGGGGQQSKTAKETIGNLEQLISNNIKTMSALQSGQPVSAGQGTGSPGAATPGTATNPNAAYLNLMGTAALGAAPAQGTRPAPGAAPPPASGNSPPAAAAGTPVAPGQQPGQQPQSAASPPVAANTPPATQPPPAAAPGSGQVAGTSTTNLPPPAAATNEPFAPQPLNIATGVVPPPIQQPGVPPINPEPEKMIAGENEEPPTA